MATPIIMPRQGQSVESCILVSWSVAPGDAIEEGAIVAEIETDKATFEVESPAAGTVLELFFEEGDDIPVLMNIAAVGDPGEDASALRPDEAGKASDAPAEKPAEAAEPVAATKDAAHGAATTSTEQLCSSGSASRTDGSPAGVSPRARTLAASAGVNPATLAGSGPGGRVIERDVQAAAAAGPALSPAARDAIAAGGVHAPVVGSGPGGRVLTRDLQAGAPAAPAGVTVMPSLEAKEIPVTGIRKIIASRMHESLSGTAQLTMNRSFDATAIQNFRKKVKAHGETYGLPSVTINDLIVFATAQTLRRHPELNAHFLGDKILQHGTVNLGIAVDTPRGLMVPVLRNAESLSIGDVGQSIKPLAEACLSGNINPDMLSGGTFTITNLGSLGVETFTPVLNAPEVAILGVGGLTLKPVRTADGIQYVDAINLSLTIDHQAVDGAPAARFLKDLVEALENIELLLSV